MSSGNERWLAGFPLVGSGLEGVTEAAPEIEGFVQALERGRVAIKRCVACQAYLHPRRIGCPECNGDDVVWVEASGLASVYSVSEVYRAPQKAFAPSIPYHVGISRLEEGVHLFCRMLPGARGDLVKVGDRGRLEVRTLETGYRLPVFVSVQAGVAQL